MNHLHRRDVLAGALAATAGLAFPSHGSSKAGWQPAAPAPGAQEGPGDQHRGPAVIASGNGLRAVQRAWELLQQKKDCCEAVVEGVRIIEDDPNDQTVGLGGLPNEDGIVELDASVMHGPTHKSGAVASVRDIKNVAALALQVLRRTDHCLLVGDGARRFAIQMGFKEENLLTEASRLAWQKWRENLARSDDHLGDEQIDRWKSDPADVPRIDDAKAAALHIPFTTGTVHCGAVDTEGDMGSCTSTSGLSWKIPGRVGDSPIIGAGNYCDNAIGSAGSTGRGEANIVTCASYAIVAAMENGDTPTQACLRIAKRVADRTREKRNLNAKGRPNFQLSLYALRKDGAFGSASLYEGGTFAAHDGREARVLKSAFLFDGQP